MPKPKFDRKSDEVIWQEIIRTHNQIVILAYMHDYHAIPSRLRWKEALEWALGRKYW